jgi:hypothetical protein
MNNYVPSEGLAKMTYIDSLVDNFGKHYEAYLTKAASRGEFSPVYEILIVSYRATGPLAKYSIRRSASPVSVEVDLERSVRIGRRKYQHCRMLDDELTKLVNQKVRWHRKYGYLSRVRLFHILTGFDVLLFRAPANKSNDCPLPFPLQGMIEPEDIYLRIFLPPTKREAGRLIGSVKRRGR